MTFHLWDEWQTLVKEHNLIVFPRDTDFLTLKKRVLKAFEIKSIPRTITIMNGDLIVSTVSSTHIRSRVKKGFPIQPLVGTKVENYIKKNKLYLR